MTNEALIQNKEDIQKISGRARSLVVACDIAHEEAVAIMAQCRMLEEVIFTPQAFMKTDDEVKEYLKRFVFVETDGRTQ